MLDDLAFWEATTAFADTVALQQVQLAALHAVMPVSYRRQRVAAAGNVWMILELFHRALLTYHSFWMLKLFAPLVNVPRHINRITCFAGNQTPNAVSAIAA